MGLIDCSEVHVNSITPGDLCETVLYRQVKRCVRLVIGIWVSDIGRVVANDVLDKRKVLGLSLR